MFLDLDKDANGTLSKEELQGYADATLTDIFIERGNHWNVCDTIKYLTKVSDFGEESSINHNNFLFEEFLLHGFCLIAFDEHVRHGKTVVGLPWEMDFESFLDFVLALENKDSPEGLTYLFRCLDLHGKGYLTAADIHILFR